MPSLKELFCATKQKIDTVRVVVRRASNVKQGAAVLEVFAAISIEPHVRVEHIAPVLVPVQLNGIIIARQ